MDEKKINKKTKRIKALALCCGLLFSTIGIAVASIVSSSDSIVKTNALSYDPNDTPHYRYTYVNYYKPYTNYIWDVDNGDWRDIAYINGTKYDDCDGFELAGAVGGVYLKRASLNYNWQFFGGVNDFTYTPYHNEDTLNTSYFRKYYTYNSNYNLIDKPNWSIGFQKGSNYDLYHPYNPPADVVHSSLLGEQTLYNGPFISGGRLYTSIICYIDESDDGWIATTANGGQTIFHYDEDPIIYRIYYVDPYGNKVEVMHNDYIMASKFNNDIVLAGLVWNNPTYRNIQILGYYVNPPYFYNYPTGISWLSILEEYNLGRNIVDSTNPITGTFILIENTLSGILPFFNLAIAPGLTLGMLILVPLVATIFFALIKVFS